MVKPRTFLAILLSLSVLLSYSEGKAIQPQQTDDLAAILYLEKADIPVWQIISKSTAGTDSNANGERFLFILYSAHFHGDSDLPTGVSFSEIVNAYDEFVKAGYSVDFVSPSGQEHVEVDGRVVTGQNYQSSAGVAKAMIAILEGQL